MIISEWEIYLFTRLDGIRDLFLFLGSLVFGVLFLVAIFYAVWINEDCYKDKSKHWKRYIGIIAGLAFTLSACVILHVAVPSTKEAAAIYLIPKIANNEQLQKVPDNALKLLNAKLEAWIKDIGKEKKEGK